LKQKNFKPAVESFLDSIQVNPFNPEAHLGLAEAYEGLGDTRDGQKEREIAKRLRTQ